jgi:hypothetical protein
MAIYILEYITFSKTSEKDVNKETGLKLDMILLPILNKSFIYENFKQVENISKERDLLHKLRAN